MPPVIGTTGQTIKGRATIRGRVRPLEVLASLAPWVAACGGAPPSGLDLTSLPSLDPAVRELLEERASAVRAADRKSVV